MMEERLVKKGFEDLIVRVKTATTEVERDKVSEEMEALTAEFESQKSRYSGKVLESVYRLKRHIGAAADCNIQMGREKGQHTIWALEALGSLEIELGRG